MSLYKVLVGYIQSETKEALQILTPAGDVVSVPPQHIASRQLAEVGGSGKGQMYRIFLNQDAVAHVAMRADSIGTDGWGTILKYYDDGSTIRKSLDDWAMPSSGSGGV